jgi:hypothetical protein
MALARGSKSGTMPGAAARRRLPEGGAMTDDLRARFDEELRHAGLAPSGRDDELLFAMWKEHLPLRDALRAAVPAMDEEPWA